MAATATPPDHERFTWLRDPKRRRGALELVRRAVADDWPMPPAARAALVAALAELTESPDLTAREALAVCRILTAMDTANLRAARGIGESDQEPRRKAPAKRPGDIPRRPALEADHGHGAAARGGDGPGAGSRPGGQGLGWQKLLEGPSRPVEPIGGRVGGRGDR